MDGGVGGGGMQALFAAIDFDSSRRDDENNPAKNEKRSKKGINEYVDGAEDKRRRAVEGPLDIKGLEVDGVSGSNFVLIKRGGVSLIDDASVSTAVDNGASKNSQMKKSDFDLLEKNNFEQLFLIIQ